MNLQINGEALQSPADITIGQLLEQLNQQPQGIAIAVNQQIVSQQAWANHRLAEGDQLAIFRAIAGG